MEVVVNNLELLITLNQKGLFTMSHDLNFVVNKSCWENSEHMHRVKIEPYIKTGMVIISSIEAVTYLEVQMIVEKYGLLRYVVHDHISIAICKQRSCRLLTDSSAMKMMAKSEGIKILSSNQVEEIILRKMEYREITKRK